MEMDFKGKKVLVTGVGKGIGRCLVKLLVTCGAEVYGISRTAEDLESLKKECPTIHTFCQDLSDWNGLKTLVETMPTFDGLVNNAAVALLDPILDLKEADLDKTLSVNVKAVLNVSQTVARKMIEEKKAGSIVNVSSQASLFGIVTHAAYGASKGAMDNITKVMAAEFGPHNIRANSVNPTVVLTDMGKIAWSDPAKAKPMKDRIPLGRFAEAEEVCHAIIYLLSDKSTMITGTHLAIDGGCIAT